MRLSLVFELLLIFILLAFAASRVIERKSGRQGPPNRYCACTNIMCNCCREFSLSVVPIKGPGCATLTYLQGDSLMVTMSFGDRVLHNTTITGRRPKPVCMPLPGGISKFCGRVYGISRQGENFKACLGLELRALDDLEAALRVSCFRFGPQGLNLEPAPPLPASETTEDDDDDDDDDDYGIVDDDDDDDDDDDGGFGIGDDDDDDDDDADDASENDVSPDYGGFSVFGDDFLGGIFGDSNKKKKNTNTNKPKPVLRPLKVSSETPILDPTPRPTKPTTKPTAKPVRVTRPVWTTVKPVRRPTPTTRKPPQRFTQPTTSTTIPTPLTKAPELPTTVAEVSEEPATSTAITFTVVQGDEAETVLPDMSSDIMAEDEAEKSESTTMEEPQTTPYLEATTEVEDTSSIVSTVEDPKEGEAHGSDEDNEDDDDDDDDDDNQDDDDDENDDDDEDEDEEGANETDATPGNEAEYKPNEKKEDEDDDDDDDLDLGLDDEDDEDDKGKNKDRRSHRPVVALRSGRTHRRMRLE